MLSDDELLTLFHSILDDKEFFSDAEEHGETLKEHITDENLCTIECNIGLFSGIPKEDLKGILEEFMVLIFRYERDMFISEHHKFMTFISNLDEARKSNSNIDSPTDLLKKPKKKIRPSTQLTQDIKTLEKSKEFFERVLNIQKLGDSGLTMRFLRVDDQQKKDLSDLYDVLDDILKDLKEKKFNIIKRSAYYDNGEPNKVEIKSFLEKVIEKYELKNISLYKKMLVDNLTYKY
ncbi:MAG: hypothetical protein ACWA5P_02130 [bacterium]